MLLIRISQWANLWKPYDVREKKSDFASIVLPKRNQQHVDHLDE